MMRSIKSHVVIPLVFFLFMQTTVLAESLKNLVLAPDSAVWLVGDSTLHPFTSRTTTINLTAALDPRMASVDGVLQKSALTQLDVSIPARSLKSHESGLDKNMYKGLKTDQYPTIDFHLAHYEVVASTASSETLAVRASGTLRIAGQEQPVTLNATMTPGPGTLRVEGMYTLLMSDYGVKPPSIMMGAIKVKNPVVIHFDLRLAVTESALTGKS